MEEFFMKKHKTEMERRQFLAGLGAITIGSLIPFNQSCKSSDRSDSRKSSGTSGYEFPTVPRRKFGKTGVELPVIGLGSGGDLREKRALLATCLQYGVNYWDTSIMYSQGNSELGIGKFFDEYPEERDNVFILTKNDDIWANIPDVEVIDNEFKSSLKKMGLESVQAYVGLHAMEAPEVQFTLELRDWAQSMKDQGKFKYFGLSTHKNMSQVLFKAASLDWIDFVLTKYDFELMYDADMQNAIEECYQAGIGLIAIKTQRNLSLYGELEVKAQAELAKYFLEKGFTEGQAKLKMVLEDKRITSAAVGMGDIGILIQNIAAVLDKTVLTSTDKEILMNYAKATCHASCKGCSYICEAALPGVPYISDIMRQLVYYNGHGDHHKARTSFSRIPGNIRKKILSSDYSQAEALCPQKIPIGKCVSEAVNLLA
jgi:uncharacterized protein